MESNTAEASTIIDMDSLYARLGDGRIDGQAKSKGRTLPTCHDFGHDDHGKTERGRYSQWDSRMGKTPCRTICGHSEVEAEKHAASQHLSPD